MKKFPPKNFIRIEHVGVPCGLIVKRIEPGFVLENGTVLLESEKDDRGCYSTHG